MEDLPAPPEFDFLKSPFPPHDACTQLLRPESEQDHSPLGLFSLFFTDAILECIVINTNRYAELKRISTGSLVGESEVQANTCM